MVSVMEVETVIARMKRLIGDYSVPSNVRSKIERAIDVMNSNGEELRVRVNTAASLLDEISNDPNIAQYTRTEVWNIASMLEDLEPEEEN